MQKQFNELQASEQPVPNVNNVPVPVADNQPKVNDVHIQPRLAQPVIPIPVPVH